MQMLGLKLDYSGQASAPAQAVAKGFNTNTFHSTFTRSKVDLGNSRARGHEWYVQPFLGSGHVPSESEFEWEGDGALTLLGSHPTEGTNIATAGRTTNPTWHGIAFGGGGYFEAKLRFDPDNSQVGASSAGWPSFWLMSIEHLAQIPGDKLWPGNSGERFGELDILEYHRSEGSSDQYNTFAGTLHEWTGTNPYTNTQTPFARIAKTPASIDYNDPDYNLIGGLWVPATGAAPGSFSWWVNGAQIGSTEVWNPPVNPSAPGPLPAWSSTQGVPTTAGGIFDLHHFVVILNTGPAQPFTISEVNVWQADGSRNWVR